MLRKRARPLFWLAFLPLILLSGVLSNWIFLTQIAYAAPTTAYSAPGHLTVQQYLNESQWSNKNKGKFKRPTTESAANKLDKNASKNKPLPSVEPAVMHDGVYTLDDSFVLHRPTMKQSVATPTVMENTSKKSGGPQKGHASPITTPTPTATPAPATSGASKGGGKGGCPPSLARANYETGGGHIADHLFYNEEIAQEHYNKGQKYSSFFSEKGGEDAIQKALSLAGSQDPNTGRWTFSWTSKTSIGDVVSARRLYTGDWKYDESSAYTVKVIFSSNCMPITAFITTQR